MSVASRVAGWNRWAGGRLGAPAGPMAPAGEHPDGVFVEIWVDEAWVDITRTSAEEPGVYYRDAITITRGQADEQQQLGPSTCSFTLNNADGRFSARNPNSPYYGKIGRNTRVRCGLVENGTRFYRFHGEISSWPKQWDITGTNVYVTVTAYGPTNRLGGKGAAPLGSVMYRALTRTAVDDLAPILAYWPMEDGAGAAAIATATPGVGPMRIAGTPTLATSSAFDCSDALPTMGTGQMTAIVPKYSSTNEIMVRFLLQIPSGGTTNGATIAAVDTTGDVARWELYYSTASSGSIGLRGLDGDGTSLIDFGALPFGSTGFNGLTVIVSIEIQQSGTAVDPAFTAYQVLGSSTSFGGGTVASSTVGRATAITLAPAKDLGDTVIGHLVVQSQVTNVNDIATRVNAYAGEYSSPRLARLCAEESVQFSRIGTVSTPMGVQLPSKLVDLLEECRTADMGFLYEPRDYLGYQYKDRSETVALTPSLTLDYAAHQFADAPIPVDDDQQLDNDVTVSRPSGSSARAVLEAGPMSILDPPDGVGRNPASVTSNLYRDVMLMEHAFWRLHMGTIDEDRYPTISLNLKHPSLSPYETLSQVLALDIGQRVDITNPPAWLPPEDITLITLGYTERFTGLEHEMVWNCAPASGYTVAQYDSTFRYGTAGSQLAAPISDTDVSVAVSTTLGPVWTQAAADFPLTVMVGGEQMTVSAVSGATSPQTFTVTRSANGIVKSHPAGTAVELVTDAVRGLVF